MRKGEGSDNRFQGQSQKRLRQAATNRQARWWEFIRLLSSGRGTSKSQREKNRRKGGEEAEGSERFQSLVTYISQIEKSIISRPKPNTKSKSMPPVSSKSSGCWKSNNKCRTTQITLPNNTRSSENLLPHPLLPMPNPRYTIPEKKNPSHLFPSSEQIPERSARG